MRLSRFHAAATVIVLAAACLRAAPLTENRFHPDEALYATFGRLIASGRDPLLSTVVVDKPPLPFYLMAASMAVFGGTEFAARLPSLLAGVLSVAGLFQLARSLYGAPAARLAALILAASPLAILFSVTLFTDTLLAAMFSLALLFTVRRRSAAAGWAFGLAFAFKQTALFCLPLLIAVALVQAAPRPDPRSANPRRGPGRDFLEPVLKFALPAGLCALAVFAWDFARRPPISFWTQGYTDNNPGRLVRANELWPRWWAWADLLQYLTGSPILNLAILAALPILLALNRRSRRAAFDYIFTGFTVSFLAGYWLLAFNVWDRYLVILAPVAALLGGRTLDRGLAGLGFVAGRTLRPASPTRSVRPFFNILIILCVAPAALTAARSGFAIGGDHGAYDGIDQIAATLQTAAPGSVLYDHWLSWELGFYLFDGPAYTAWMPGPGALADDLRAFGRRSPRYIVSPSWESFAEMQQAIEAAGFKTEVVRQTIRRDGSVSFTLYRIIPQ